MKFNRTRLQLLICGMVSVVTAIYGVFLLVPTYHAFAEDAEYRWSWKVAGFDDPAVQKKHFDACTASLAKAAPSAGAKFPFEERAQYDSLCSEPSWDPWSGDSQKPNIPVQFIWFEGLKILIYFALAVVLAPWAFAFLLVRVLPRVTLGLWGWLTS
jgi:hypothetical protein